MQTGLADMSIFFGVGLAPSKATLPVTVPPFASSGVAEPPPAGGAAALSVFGASAVFSPPPHPARLERRHESRSDPKLFHSLNVSLIKLDH